MIMADLNNKIRDALRADDEEALADLADEPGALPLLQYALTQAFDARRGRHISAATYREVGGVADLGRSGREWIVHANRERCRPGGPATRQITEIETA